MFSDILSSRRRENAYEEIAIHRLPLHQELEDQSSRKIVKIRSLKRSDFTCLMMALKINVHGIS